jgi:hypothetical protein
MAGGHDRRDLAEFEFVALVDEALRLANPNSTRQGCPSHDVLVALTGREPPIEDPAYDHLLDARHATPRCGICSWYDS